MISSVLSTPDLSNRDLRQRDIVPPDKLALVHAVVIGVGAVGRQVALQLAAVGVPELTLIDFDRVDVVNLAPQGYLPTDVGRVKVEATGEQCKLIHPQVTLHLCPDRFRRSSPRSFACFEVLEKRPVVFCCVDSIITRGIVWDAVKELAPFFVDARMSAEVVRVLASDQPSADSHYPTTLFTRDEAFVGSCTAKSTIYTASIAAGLMMSQFTKWLRGMPVDQDVTLNLLAIEMAGSAATLHADRHHSGTGGHRTEALGAIRHHRQVRAVWRRRPYRDLGGPGAASRSQC